MPRYLAVVDTDTETVFIEHEDVIVEYHISMYAAALQNDKYWPDAEIRALPYASILEIVIGKEK